MHPSFVSVSVSESLEAKRERSRSCCTVAQLLQRKQAMSGNRTRRTEAQDQSTAVPDFAMFASVTVTVRQRQASDGDGDRAF